MNAGRVFYNVSMALALAVGALQMFHVRGGLLTDYGAALSKRSIEAARR